ncbi:MAG: DNA sulfur modification protein DndE [Planctomycetota bacterium]|nr:DNA sulfur modification protein DndE [Planctomycetota bacterium]
MFLETIKLSQRAKEQLVQLKRRTGIKNWNVLCRWGFAKSLLEPTLPPRTNIPADSSVEMSWRVFGGEHADIYAALMRLRCHEDGVGTDDETLAQYFRIHLHRGIGYLFADKSLQRVGDLAGMALSKAPRDR